MRPNDNLSVNTIRVLSAEAINKSNQAILVSPWVLHLSLTPCSQDTTK